MDAGSNWRLAIIEIVGEDGESEQANGPKLPDWLELINDFRSELNEVSTTLEEYMNEVATAYERAKKAKEELLATQGKVTDDVFNKVNATIDEYNGKLDQAQSLPQGEAFKSFPRMTRVTPGMLEDANNWRRAKEEQYSLEDEKQALDQERERLTAEFNRLAEEGRNLKQMESDLANLEESAKRAASETQNSSGPVQGPFTLYTGQYSNTRGSKQGVYDDFLQARAIGRRHMSENSSKQPNYRITDSAGNDIEYDGLFGSKSVSAAQLRPPANVAETQRNLDSTLNDLSQRKSSTQQRRQAYWRDLAQYKADLQKYKKRLAAYESRKNSQMQRIESLANATYRPVRAPVPRTSGPQRPRAPLPAQLQR